MSDLKPCPICGADAEQNGYAGDVYCSGVHCYMRHCYIPARVWQSLPRQTALDAMRERAEKAEAECERLRDALREIASASMTMPYEWNDSGSHYQGVALRIIGTAAAALRGNAPADDSGEGKCPDCGAMAKRNAGGVLSCSRVECMWCDMSTPFDNTADDGGEGDALERARRFYTEAVAGVCNPERFLRDIGCVVGHILDHLESERTKRRELARRLSALEIATKAPA